MAPNGVEILHVTPADKELFRSVAPDVFDHAIDFQRLAVYLATPGHLMLVAVAEGNIVAQIAAVVHHHVDAPSELYVDNLGVAPEFKRRGIATALLKKLIAIGRDQGCGEAWVATELDNAAANGLYRRFAEAEEFVMYAWQLKAS